MTTLDEVKAADAIGRVTLHQRLRKWFAATEADATVDPTLGPVDRAQGPIGRSAWVHVRDEAGDLFCLHADVWRSSVAKYLELIDRHGDAIEWTVVPNQRGRENAVAYGPERVRVTPFYLYLVKRHDG